jgi:hypothetical protein
MSQPDPERNQIVYVTGDNLQWAILDVPFGMIAPPTIEIHQPTVRSFTFYYADCYAELHVPSEAEAYLARSETVD